MIVTRAISVTSFTVASTALAFQVFVLYPWHKELDESFEKLRVENMRVLDQVRTKPSSLKEKGDERKRGLRDYLGLGPGRWD